MNMSADAAKTVAQKPIFHDTNDIINTWDKLVQYAPGGEREDWVIGTGKDGRPKLVAPKDAKDKDKPKTKVRGLYHRCTHAVPRLCSVWYVTVNVAKCTTRVYGAVAP